MADMEQIAATGSWARFESLTTKLEDIVRARYNGAELPANAVAVQYDMPKTTASEDGTGDAFKVFRQGDDIAALVIFMPAGHKFPWHTHDEHEIGIVFAGKEKGKDGLIRVNIDGSEYEIGVGDSVDFRPGVLHSGLVIRDTWMLFVTVPADPGYPR